MDSPNKGNKHGHAKDKSAWSGFEQPLAGPKGEGQEGLHKRYPPKKREKRGYALA